MGDKEKSLHVCGLSAIAMIVLLIAAALTGCKAHKDVAQTLSVTTIQDNTDTRIIHTERIDTLYISIPAQSAVRTTPQGFSHLETDYAKSDARINEDGTLTHTLDNKAVPVPVPVKNSTDSIYVDRYVEKPVPVEVPIEVEKKLSWWETFRLDTWWWLAGWSALGVVIIARKPIIAFARRLI